MTGFGRASREVEGIGLEVEARSVNHRHLDLRIRLPRVFADQEARLKGRVQSRLSRGKVDISVNLASGEAATRLEIDETIAAQYVAAARSLADRHGLPGPGDRAGAAPLDAAALLSLPGVTRLVETEVAAATLVDALDAALDEAIDALVAMRAAEGSALLTELSGRLSQIEILAERFDGRSREVVEVARQRLRKRAEQIERDVGLLDEARLHQEIVIAADRLDITEELVRLRSHVEQFRETLAAAGPNDPVGRRLDFLLQELGREANTVGSKASDAPLAQDVVELKTELERIREQVQNVE